MSLPHRVEAKVLRLEALHDVLVALLARLLVLTLLLLLVEIPQLELLEAIDEPLLALLAHLGHARTVVQPLGAQHPLATAAAAAHAIGEHVRVGRLVRIVEEVVLEVIGAGASEIRVSARARTTTIATTRQVAIMEQAFVAFVVFAQYDVHLILYILAAT